MHRTFRISGTLARQLAERRLPLAAVLRRAGLPEAFFRQEKALATTGELFALWRAIAETSGDPAIGLELGSDTRAECGGAPQTIAALYSESFLDAVQRMGRYKKLTCPEEIVLRHGREECAVEFVFLLATEAEPPVFVDLCLAWILAIGRRGTGRRIAPLRVELTREPAHRELLETHYGCRILFRARRNALVLRPADLRRAFVAHSPELLALIGPPLEAELAATLAQENLGERVKTSLKPLLAGRRASLADVARALGRSTRTLQRQLTAQGVTFQGLLRETRRELAHHYLGQSSLELTETAYLLGFDDANSFFRAFQDWEGISPLRWRCRHQCKLIEVAGVPS